MELFIDNLTEVYTSPYFSDNKTSVLTLPDVQRMPLTSLDKNLMVQWSDMILFDFLIGHADRLFFNLYFHHINDRPVKNLYKTPSSKLVLIDNESAFQQGYTGGIYYKTPSQYETHASFFKRTCAFRRHTVEGILNLDSRDINSSSPLVILQNYIKEKDPFTYSLILRHVSKKQMENIDRNMRERILEIRGKLRLCQSL